MKFDRGALPYNVWCISYSNHAIESRRDFSRLTARHLPFSRRVSLPP
jgi:hypothetical protein